MRLPLVLACALLALPLHSVVGGASPFPQNVRVTTTQGPANEVHIAVNPLDARNLVVGAKDYSLGPSSDCGRHRVWAGAYWSADGGRTWGNGLVPGWPGGPPSVLTAFPCSTDPVVGFDGRGHARFVGLAHRSPRDPSMVWTAASLDGGASWPVVAPVAASPTGQAFFDKEWFAVDPDTGLMYVTWTVFGSCLDIVVTCFGAGVGIHIVLARCVLGLACSPPQALTTPVVGDACSGLTQGSYPAVGPDGRVHVAWVAHDFLSGTLRVCHTVSTDHGLTFGPGKVIAQGVPVNDVPNSRFRVPTLPAMAVDRSAGPTRGNVYAVWSDHARDASDVALVRSRDAGATWSPPTLVNSDAPGASNFFPAIAVAPDGRVDVAFYDRRDDPADELMTAYLASSRDGGATWTNERVGEALFDGDLGFHQGGQPFIGDYIGVASTENMAFPVWADTRGGRSDAFVALVPR